MKPMELLHYLEEVIGSNPEPKQQEEMQEQIDKAKSDCETYSKELIDAKKIC